MELVISSVVTSSSSSSLSSSSSSSFRVLSQSTLYFLLAYSTCLPVPACFYPYFPLRPAHGFSSLHTLFCHLFGPRLFLLQKNSSLKHLFLKHNRFEQRAAFYFKHALSHNITLETLDLSWNCFSTRSVTLVAKGVQVSEKGWKAEWRSKRKGDR